MTTGARFDASAIGDLADAVVARDRRALAKAITLVESTLAEDEALAEQLLERVLPHTGRALRVGISGAPGVGKSTFIDALGLDVIAQGMTIAVLTIDPSSSLSGGSILGDRTRMPGLAARSEAFIRQSPSSGTLGGVARRTREAMLLCEAAGFDRIVVETVGVGQSEYAVASMVDVFVLLLMPGAGDELQGIKRGILELVDLVFVNKADGDQRARAERAARAYSDALAVLRPSRDAGAVPAVACVSALERRGIDAAQRAIVAYRDDLERRGELAQKRAAQRLSWLDSAVHDALEARWRSHPELAKARSAIADDVAQGQMSPREAARRLLGMLNDKG